MNKYYYLDGLVLCHYDAYLTLHRLDGPAVEHDNGDKYWYQNGKRHRLDGPAAEWGGGVNKNWCQNGQLHRVGGPAVEYFNGGSQWYQNGKLHRLDGPALECRGGGEYWFINGKEFTKEKFERQVLIMQLSGLLNG